MEDEPLEKRIIMGAVGHLKIFNPETDDWEIYKEVLDQYFIVNDIIENRKKSAILLCSIGDESYKLLQNLCLPKKTKDFSYEELVKFLNMHLSPKRSVFAERFKFHKAFQAPEEKIACWFARLKQLAKFCNFGANLDDTMRDRFIVGLESKPILDRLLSESDTISCDKVVEIATNMEAALSHAGEIRQELVPLNSGMYNVQKQFLRELQRKHFCTCCGNNNHTFSTCKYRNYKCHNCYEKGHLQKMCNKSQKLKKGTQEVHSIQQKLAPKEDSIQVPEDSTYEDGLNSKEGVLFNIENSHFHPFMVEMIIEGIMVKIEIDTGASISSIPEELYKKQFSFLSLQSTPYRLKSYTCDVIQPAGMVKVNIMYHGQWYYLNLYVIPRGSAALLGKDWIMKMKIDMPVLCNLTELLQSLKDL